MTATDRRCAHCNGPMLRGQRAMGSGETEGEFARRIHCSLRCQYAAQVARSRAARLRRVLKRHGLAAR